MHGVYVIEYTVCLSWMDIIMSCMHSTSLFQLMIVFSLVSISLYTCQCLYVISICVSKLVYCGTTSSLVLWTPNLPYRIPATVLQILPLVVNLWGCLWDKFVLFILFSFVVYVICLFQVLMPACLSLLSIVWNKCARHAGSGQCFRPALFWRHHTRLGVQFLGCHGMWP